MHFADRTNWNGTLTPLGRAHAEACRRGQALLDLTQTNPTHCGFAYAGRGLEAALAAPESRRYEPHPFGRQETRCGVAAYYAAQGRAVGPDRVMLTAGTSEAYAHLFRLLANPGDTVLVPSPSYPLLDVLAHLHDLRLRPYPLHYDGRWWVDLEALEAALDPTCRALVVISPNNPTGSLISTREREALLALAARRGLALIVDEVFSDFGVSVAPDAAGSLAGVEGPGLVFVLNGISKMMGLPQMKLAWTAISGEEALAGEAARRLEHIADAYLSVGTPVQVALASWWSQRTEIQSELLTRVRENLRLAEQGLLARCLHVEAGWSAILRVPAVAPDDALALRLLTREGVVVDPGSLYGLPATGHLVVSLLTPTAAFAEGLRRLETALADPRVLTPDGSG